MCAGANTDAETKASTKLEQYECPYYRLLTPGIMCDSAKTNTEPMPLLQILQTEYNTSTNTNENANGVWALPKLHNYMIKMI